MHQTLGIRIDPGRRIPRMGITTKVETELTVCSIYTPPRGHVCEKGTRRIMLAVADKHEVARVAHIDQPRELCAG